VIGIYQPIKNDFLNKKVNSTRSRFGLLMYSTKVVPETFEKYKNEVTATILAIDQSPGNPNKSYWLEFLNQDSATLFGTEKYAVKYNYPVIYGEIQRVKRGFYEVEFKLLCENPDQTQYGEITTMTMKMLEKTIQRKPENWLWTHKRWKHKRKKE
jgi:KDO2-lipid IV(A) lauroyltransferase